MREYRQLTISVVLIFRMLTFCHAVKVRVGHIGAVGYMKNGEKILEISRKELWQDGVLGDDFDIEINNQMGCGEALEGVAVGADMYHVQNVRAFIGPYCNAELDAVAKMATFWNIPIVGYMASSNTFADKSIYKTLARVSLRTTNSLAEAVAAILSHYGWTKKPDHRVGGLPAVRLTSRGIQSLTALVHRLSFIRITCPAYLIFDCLAYKMASLIFDR
uniref:ANF_receptor domain-containing protein n=1 Tax=Angiostrongylus cantonensis TaxID=6313 RepID=A0A0K0D1T4_ANGCA